MTEYDHIDPNCRIASVLDIFKGRWKGEIIAVLRSGPKRFSTLRSEMPAASARSLTESLRALERDGILQRRQFEEIPPHVEYSLTARGRELLPLLDQIQRWGEVHLSCVEACRETYDHQAS
ncbi:MAG: helix-turn-helix domain-containing protein [Planctomycetota bacterium]